MNDLNFEELRDPTVLDIFNSYESCDQSGWDIVERIYGEWNDFIW